MFVSFVGGVVGFVISTQTTRNSILDGQLEHDIVRLEAAFAQQNRDTIEAARLLAEDHVLIDTLIEAQTHTGHEMEEEMVEMAGRAVNVRDRFGLDQVLVLNDEGQVRVNIAPSYLESISVQRADMFPACPNVEAHLMRYHNAHLLTVCAPIFFPPISSEDTSFGGYVYTLVDLGEWLRRVRVNIDLESQLTIINTPIVDDEIAAVGQYVLDDQSHSTEQGYRVRNVQLPVGSDHLPLTFRLEEQQINEILNSGFLVMVSAMGATLLLVLLAGAWLARRLLKPVLHLAKVADAVAAGDLSRRANLMQQDEFGVLGRSFDMATDQIAQLLDQKARTSGERKAILESIADGLVAVDTDERIVIINSAAASLLGKDADIVKGQPLTVLSMAEDPTIVVGMEQIVLQLRSELVDPDLAPTEEYVNLGHRTIRLNSAPTLVNGTITGAVVVLQDVTQAVESDRAKSAFIATASHELRTPLTSLKGFVDLFNMTGSDNLNDDQKVCLDTIGRQTRSVILLVNDLLEMARLEQGTQHIERQWVQTRRAIEDAVGSMQGLMEQRQVTVTLHLAPDLPPIWIDNLHLQRILTNLISNGIKYVYSGGQVNLHAYAIDAPDELPNIPTDLPWQHPYERSLVIAVEDNGVGIRTEDQPKIFTRFFRSENPLSVEVGGTGLGLAVTHSLVALHGGQIGFRSLENEGSYFWVRLPISSTEPLTDQQTTTSHIASLSAVSMSE